ncbi:hypothetical protein [Thiohalocapsa halophila]|jgi:hypothetical protein
MSDAPTRKCPFAAPITTARAACRHATEVVRRGGSEYDCADAAAHDRCTALFAGLKRAGLDAFQVEDDLTQMPHSVLVKIQTGGLTGLRRLLEPATEADAPIADVAALAAQAADAYGGVEQVPVAALAEDMRACKLERRGRRRGR